jgi:hypothetical protein
MSKAGWVEIRTRFLAATGLLHTTEQLSCHYRNLKAEWRFCNFLRYEATGIGRDSAGRPVADDEWWKNHTKVRLGRCPCR